MPEGRPEIPTELQRAVLLEAGHRCAIPTCRHPTTELAHIVPWAEVKEHKFENLIALCPNCHTRYDRKEIDRKAMLAYKFNLPVVASRYTSLERRMLAELGAQGDGHVILVPGGSRFLFLAAEKDGLLEYLDAGVMRIGTQLMEADRSMNMTVETVGGCRLTAKGRDFASRWLSGRALAE